MSCKKRIAALPLLVLCLWLGLPPAQAAAPAVTEEEQAIAAQLAQEEAEARANPLIPPVAGGIGLAALLAFGTITSRKQRTQEEAGYDPLLEDRRIGDPYSRLTGTGKHRRRG